MSLIRHGFMRGLGVMSHAGVGMLVPLGDLALRAIGHHALRWAGRLLGVCPFDGRFGMVAARRCLSVCLSVCRTPPVRPLISSRIASSHVRCLLLRCAPTPTSSSACRPRRCSQRRSVQSLSGTQACTCVRAGVPGCALARICLRVLVHAGAEGRPPSQLRTDHGFSTFHPVCV
jgi:hypothetical protein